MCFTSIMLDTIRVLARNSCTYAIQVITVHHDVKCGLLGGNQLEAIAALRRIVEDLEVDCIEDVYKILNESKVEGELVAEPTRKRKYESEAALWDEGRALLTTEGDAKQLVTDEQKIFEQPNYRPSSPAYSPTDPERRPALPSAEWDQSPAYWVDDADDL